MWITSSSLKESSAASCSSVIISALVKFYFEKLVNVIQREYIRICIFEQTLDMLNSNRELPVCIFISWPTVSWLAIVWGLCAQKF